MRAVKFYFGVAIPTTLCWLAVVTITAVLGVNFAIWKTVVAAIVGVPLAIVAGAYCSREDEKSSFYFVSQVPDSDLLKRGMRFGLVIGPASLLGVAVLAAIPLVLDRVFTAFGR